MIIVTRPHPEGNKLVSQLVAVGIPAKHMPLFTILPTVQLDLLQSKLNILTTGDIVIAVSPRVISSIQSHCQSIYFPNHLSYIAIGKKTANRLQQLITVPVIYPPHQENTEGVLLLPQLNTVAQKRVLILRGNQGRDLLAHTLRQRGATVEYVECYKKLPTNHWNGNIHHLPKNTMITLTNTDSLHYLNTRVSTAIRHHFQLIVCSERIAKEARQFNWSKIILSNSANNQILFKTIITVCHNEKRLMSTG